METVTPAAGRRCRCCGAPGQEAVLHDGGFPALCNAFAATADEARAMPLGSFELLVCERCGALRNAAFDPDLLPYDDHYENSLHQSPTFDRFARELAADLATRHGLAGSTVVEVGSGRGDFLRVLADHGLGQAYGIDPSLPASEELDDAGSPISLRAGTLADLPEVTADLVLCRHVLEHVDQPVALLAEMRRRLARPGTVLYVEVPDAGHMLRAPAVWDLIYEHVGYFTGTGIDALLRRAGWTVTATGTSYGGQYLWAEATCPDTAPTGGETIPDEIPVAAAADPGLALARAFAAHRQEAIERWERALADAAHHRRRVAVWGAGSKGVAFLNAVAGSGPVEAVVDVNERKHRRFVPGVGSIVETPHEVAGRVDTVLVMNPIYLDEIRATGESLGFEAEYLAVGG